jgi:Fur family transcriptional regulator, zinc uptake regulator
VTDGFSTRTAALLDHAETMCQSRGAKLTGLRRQVLGLILEAPQPAGAYELLDRLRERRGPAAPPTVYRALEFLQEQGLVHRIESLSAFVGCVDAQGNDHGHGHGHGHEHAHPHRAQFLICRHCRRVTEIEDHGLAHALAAAAKRVGFAVTGATIEAEGMCADCAAHAKA